MQRISQDGLDFIKGFESFVPYVYDDKRAPVRGKYREWAGEAVVGTLTIGYGHTDAAKHPLKIKRGLRISETEACEILDVDLDECEQQVRAMVKVPLEQGQFDALVSFNFNCGPGNLKNIVARLNRGNYAAARAAFDLYTKSKGEYMRGLQRRRDGEQALWDDETIVPPVDIVDHPAAVDHVEPPPTNMAQSTEGNAAAATGAAGTTTTAILISNAVKGAGAGKTLTAWGLLVALLEQPEFWAALIAGAVMIGGPLYLWLRRKSRLDTQGV